MNTTKRVEVISLQIQDQINAMLDELGSSPWPIVSHIEDQLSFGMKITNDDEFRIQVTAFPQGEPGSYVLILSGWFSIEDRRFKESNIYALSIPQAGVYAQNYMISDVDVDEELYSEIYGKIREFIPECVVNILS
ncbi:lectin domain-containing protein [Aeromonas phage AerS_266]|nr:lectin domain-containing protein [Aeromonas phage AerS_266]